MNFIIDTELINSASIFLNLSYRELEEFQYRLKILKNEMIEDTNLQLAPEYSILCDNLEDLSKNIQTIKNQLSVILPAFCNISEKYENVEHVAKDQIANLILNSQRKSANITGQSIFKRIEKGEPKSDDEIRAIINSSLHSTKSSLSKTEIDE